MFNTLQEWIQTVASPLPWQTLHLCCIDSDLHSLYNGFSIKLFLIAQKLMFDAAKK